MNQINLKDLSDNRLRAIYFERLSQIEESTPIVRAIELEFKKREEAKKAVQSGETIGQLIEKNKEEAPTSK